MRLDKRLKDIIEQQQEEKRKREEKDQEKAQAITEITAILQDLDPKIEETKQERNQEQKDKIIKETSKRKSSKTDKDITVRDHNKKIADKLKEYQDTSDDEEGHEEKRKRKKAITQAAWKRIRKKNREPRVNLFYG